MITKIIIQYVIQIRHTDDFPSTGTRLVVVIMLAPQQDFVTELRIFFRKILYDYYTKRLPRVLST